MHSLSIQGIKKKNITLEEKLYNSLSGALHGIKQQKKSLNVKGHKMKTLGS